jgi:spermidine synthase
MTNVTARLKSFIQQFNKAATKKSHEGLFVFDEDETRSLHFDIHTIQSVMLKADPDTLVLGYTRKMMGFLLFKPKPKRIAMIGLGGGSLAKYCAKYLPDTHFTAVEINPHVIAIRDQFHIPPDSNNFCILQADGAEYVANKTEKVDVLLVDGFDKAGQPAKLSSAGFYDNCYTKLNEGGVMVVNLHGSNAKFGTFASRIRQSFDDKVVIVACGVDSNKIAFAYKGKDFPVSSETLMERADYLSKQHPTSLNITAQKIQQRLATHQNNSDWKRVSRTAF